MSAAKNAARILITGSTDGLGLAAARQLIQRNHSVYLHARNQQRADEVKQKVPGAAGVLVADLTTASAARQLANDANAIGTFDAVLLNAGLMYGPYRKTESGAPAAVFVNLAVPYIMSSLLNRPKRLIFISSILHHEASTDVKDMFWLERGEGKWDDFQAYCESKLQVMLLSKAIARRFQGTSVTAIHPGWIPTKLSGKGAPDKMEHGVETYVKLAEGDYDQSLTGIYVGPRGEIIQPRPEADDQALQDSVLTACENFTGVKL